MKFCLQLLKNVAGQISLFADLIRVALSTVALTTGHAESKPSQGLPPCLQLVATVSNELSETPVFCRQLSPLPLGERQMETPWIGNCRSEVGHVG